MDADAARTAPPAPSVIPFPTLVMAGIVNSIASELDAVGAPRKRPGVRSNAAQGTYLNACERGLLCRAA